MSCCMLLERNIINICVKFQYECIFYKSKVIQKCRMNSRSGSLYAAYIRQQDSRALSEFIDN